MKIRELGHVVLYVSDLKRSADFYKTILGFEEIHRGEGVALFSSGRTHHELLLMEVGPSTSLRASGEPDEKTAPKPGLYHIGFKIGDTDAELKAALAELHEHKVTIVGAGDHGVTHSLYVLDPDGNELELYIDVGDEWKRDPKAVMAPVKPLKL